MITLKFGGTSVGRPERMQHIANLLTQNDEKKIVVLSALSGTTNALVEIGQKLFDKDIITATKLINDLHTYYKTFIDALYSKDSFKKTAYESINDHFDFLQSLLKAFFNKRLNNELLAQGELMLTIASHRKNKLKRSA